MKSVLSRKSRIRSPVGAGIFYPEDKHEILKYFRLNGLKKDYGGNAQAIIAPHGAWSFSGSLAANAFSSAAGRSGSIENIVILGPIHDKREDGVFLSNSHFFSTPLGNIPVNKHISEELKYSSKYLEIDDIPHLSEHSIEILLPFIKFCFPYASIVPILMGQPKQEYINDLALALNSVISPIIGNTLFVISCNLSSDNNLETAQCHAEECMRLFSQKDVPALVAAIRNGSINACGSALVVSLFESGLLDEKCECKAADYMISAANGAGGREDEAVFYSAISFG